MLMPTVRYDNVCTPFHMYRHQQTHDVCIPFHMYSYQQLKHVLSCLSMISQQRLPGEPSKDRQPPLPSVSSNPGGSSSPLRVTSGREPGSAEGGEGEEEGEDEDELAAVMARLVRAQPPPEVGTIR